MQKGIFPGIAQIRKIGNLRCPDCLEVMIPHLCQNVIIDKCPLCEGIWFDHKEFGIFKRSLDAYDLSMIQEIYRPTESDRFHISSCPRCDTPLYEVNYSYNSGIKVKKCAECEGLWLPIHEILNLIEHAKISQDISSDLKGLAKELKNQEKDRQKIENLKRIGKQLNRRVPIRRPLMLSDLVLLLPLYDENPRSIFPLATFSLIVVNTLIFIFMMTSDLPLTQIYSSYALTPREIINFQSIATLLTSMFVHAGVFHLIGNMFFLWTFGDNVEERLGSSKYLFFYLFCGLFASGVHILINPASTLPAVGASGAISGILGAYLFFFPHVNIKTLMLGYIVDLPAWAYLGVWIGLQIVWAVLYGSIGEGGIAWWAHIGGFFAGLSMAFLARKMSET